MSTLRGTLLTFITNVNHEGNLEEFIWRTSGAPKLHRLEFSDHVTG